MDPLFEQYWKELGNHSSNTIPVKELAYCIWMEAKKCVLKVDLELTYEEAKHLLQYLTEVNPSAIDYIKSALSSVEEKLDRAIKDAQNG